MARLALRPQELERGGGHLPRGGSGGARQKGDLDRPLPQEDTDTLYVTIKKKKSPSIYSTPSSSLPPPKQGQASVIPTDARASVAQVGQRVGSPYMVLMKSLTKAGKRFSTMLARTALISRS